VGKLQVQDSEDLHLIPFAADVRVKQPKPDEKDIGYGPKNTARYLPLEAKAATPVARPAASPT